MLGLYIFRRDFRISDNATLDKLISLCDKICFIFIFDPYQIDVSAHNKSYFSEKSARFMCECLQDLSTKIKIHFYYGNPSDVLEEIITSVNGNNKENKENKLSYVAFNADYSVYSIKRDAAIKKTCDKYAITTLIGENDHLLYEINPAPKVFSVYYKKCTETSSELYLSDSDVISSITEDNIKKFVKAPEYWKPVKKSKVKLNDLLSRFPNLNDSFENPTRKKAIKLAKRTMLVNYDSNRDKLTYETSYLSSYLKFGVLSIREAYYLFTKIDNKKSKQTLIKQLYWRSWYFIKAKQTPTFDYKPLLDKKLINHDYSKLKWFGTKEQAITLWEKCETGFPIIDAAMRELKETGFMHNRGRLLVANFSVKILGLNPFDTWGGQEIFSRMLIDCCYANNFGNWMWILGPYDAAGFRFGKANTFSGRIFDVTTPSKLKDYNSLAYIRKWIPELIDIPDKDVLNWYKSHGKYKTKTTYPAPMVNVSDQIEKWQKITRV